MNKGTGKCFHFFRPYAHNYVVSQRSGHNHPLCFFESGLIVAQLLWGLLRHCFLGTLEAACSPLWIMVSWLMPHFSVIAVDSQNRELYSCLYLTV